METTNIGQCTLIQGDCLEVIPQLIQEGVTVDLVLTDPPYGTTNNSKDIIIPFNEMWSCIKGIEVVNGVDTDEQDIIQDFVSIITSFCARLYGKRRSRRKTEQLIEELKCN